jgi:DNA (cytosine-5)-methyltransferase 1
MYDGVAYETLVRELGELGYDTKSQILNAADYGAPQIRYRTVVLGWKRGLPPLDFPPPTNGNKRGLRPYLTLMEAISDLPPIGAGESSSDYATPPQNEYQRRMRGEQKKLLEHNASNYGEKMQEILRIIPEGGSIKDLPMRLRPKSAYCNTYARLIPTEPSPTITRNFGTPSSSRCVHPFQPRALSTREGARLQGFPDDYIFVGGKQSKNLQIGNAVPPILGEAIATVVREALQKAEA